MNRSEWAEGFLDYSGWPTSAENVTALVAQMAAVDTEAPNNPLGLTEPDPNATDYDAAGTKAYATLEQGYGATLTALGPTSTLAQGDQSATEWGRTHGCLSQVEQIKAGDEHDYAAAEVVITNTEPPATVPYDQADAGYGVSESS